MIIPKKIIKMARKWHKLGTIKRKTISFPRTNRDVDTESSCASMVASKGHFIVSTTDRKRFEVPLAYLSKDIFRELLRISEEEFGLPCDGPIRVPCDALFMEYIISLIQRGLAKDLEKALLMSVATFGCSLVSSFHQGHTNQQVLVC